MKGRSNPDAAEHRTPTALPVEVLAAIVEGLPLAILVLAADGTPVYTNAAADTLLGRPTDRPLSPGSLASAYGAVEAGTGQPYPVERMPIVRALAGDTVTVDDMELDRSNGTVAVEVWAAPILGPDSGVTFAVAAFQDISERRHAEERAARLHDETVRQSRWLAVLHEIQATVLSGAGRDDALHLVVRQARELIGGDSTSVGGPDGDGFLVVRAADGQDAAALTGTRFSIENSIMGEVVGMGAAAVLDDIGCHGSLDDPVVRMELGPAVFVPLGTEGQVLGSLCVARSRGGALFTEGEVAAAEAFANQAGLALQARDAHRESAHLVLDRDRARTAEDLQGVLQSVLSARDALSEMPAETGPQVLGSAGAFEYALENLGQGVLQLRSHIDALRPVTPATAGLEKELLDMVGEFEARTGIVTVVHVDGEAAGALGRRGPVVLDIVREALSEVGAHAAARTCRVRLGRVPEGLLLQVDHDAPGFRDLADLAEWPERLGGRLEVRTVPGSGTSITATLPTS